MNTNDKTPFNLSDDAVYEETDAVRAAKEYVMQYLRAIEARAAGGCEISQQLLDMHHNFLIARGNQAKANQATAFLWAYSAYILRVIEGK